MWVCSVIQETVLLIWATDNGEYLAAQCCNWPVRIKHTRGPWKKTCQKTPCPCQLLQMWHKQSSDKQHYCLAWKLWQKGLADHGKIDPVGRFNYDWGPPPCHWRYLHWVEKKSTVIRKKLTHPSHSMCTRPPTGWRVKILPNTTKTTVSLCRQYIFHKSLHFFMHTWHTHIQTYLDYMGQ